MANVDRPHGFTCWGPVLRARLYPVPTAPTINVAVQDIVQADTTGHTSAKLGSSIGVYDGAVIPATPGDAYLLLGTVLACFDEDMDPIKYIAAGRVGDGTTAGYVLVADHPAQQMEAQADATVTIGNVDLNYEITSATLSAPNTNTGISTQEINVSGATTTNTIPIRLYAMAFPAEDSLTNAGGRWVCGFNPICHYYGATTAL